MFRLGLLLTLLLAGAVVARAAEEDKAAVEAKETKTEAAAEPAETDKEEKAEAKEEKEEQKAEEKKEQEPATPEQLFEGGEKTYNNWVELSFGGFLTHGNTAEAQSRHRHADGAFGGIEDLHYQGDVAKKTTLSIDGRGLFDEHDYKLTLGLQREEMWYVRFGFENARTWDSDDGGYFPPTGLWYSRTDDALALDRGEIFFEGGLTLKKLPALNFKYQHLYRDGEKGATTWGQTHPDIAGAPSLLRGLSPAFQEIDEQRDIFQLDARHRIKATDVGLGLRYETGDLDNARKVLEYPGEPVQRGLTDREGTTYDLFSVHTFTETWIKKNLFFSSGFLFANLDSDFSGSRIYGDDFDVGYVPGYPRGYTDLNGGAQKHEYVLNLNLMSRPLKTLTIVPSVRVQREDWDAESDGMGTQSADQRLFSGQSERELLEVRERLDVRYTGFTNWVLYTAGEWTQGDGNLTENDGLSQPGPITSAPNLWRETDDTRFFQKYALGARWYPTRRLSLDVGGYYKLNAYEYDHERDSTANNSAANRYPAYLVMQDFETYDGNIRVTYRPLNNLTLVSRYEYQLSTVHTKPDSVSGLGEVESSEMTSHIFAQNVSWTPWSRLSFQVGFNYVTSETETGASDYTQAVLDAQNNYWTVNFDTGLVLDEKSDLNLGYFFYRADNYEDNSYNAAGANYDNTGVPYGVGATEHGIMARYTRRLTERLRLTLRYGYFHYDDETSGGHNDYESHLVSSSLQYRF